MKILESSRIIQFAMSCIANAKPSRELQPGMQTFKSCFDMPLNIKDFNKKWNSKIQRKRKQHIYDLGYMAIYGKEDVAEYLSTMSGTIEQLSRNPKETDDFYFEYFVAGNNYVHRFLKFNEWDAKKGDLIGNVRPMRRAMLLTECRLILNKEVK